MFWVVKVLDIEYRVFISISSCYLFVLLTFIECDCDDRGTQAGIGTCDSKSGQCSCKHSVTERGCSECRAGSFNLTESNIFGCTGIFK